MAGVLTFLQGRDRDRHGRLARLVASTDDAVERRLAPRRSPKGDAVFYSLSSAADHGLLWLTIGAVRAALVPRHRRSFVRLAVAMGVESAITNGMIKTPFRRRRPPDEFAGGPLPYGMHRPITSAFPSGHAASAFTAAGLLSEGDRLGPLYHALAVGVAASRVYVRMHHASDVVAGAVWGALFAQVVRRRFPLD